MNNTLLSKIAQDLNIIQFIEETQNLYTSRVIYSALAAWMKVIPLDGYDGNNLTSSVTKKYHTERSKEVLDEILCFFPEVRCWFYDAESSQDNNFPLHSIQELLVVSNELFIDDMSNRICAVAQTVKRNSVILADNIDISEHYNGVCCLSPKRPFVYDNKFIDSSEFFNNLIECMPFSADNWNVEKEYFDPSIRTTTFYKSWVDKPPKQKYYISRIETGIKQYRYFVETQKNGKCLSSKLNDFFVESGNLKRVLLYLRSVENNPLVIKAFCYKDHVKVNRNITSLPYPEEYMLRFLGWPIHSISDRLNYVYNKEVWSQIRRIIENLMIDIDEVNYERSV
ncbi:hypothetical protein [Hydrogenoanaerobacterium sp.]|uniref:hypothetical protein n=1 Tax=Hydrogenoanaerobacterium sp. TaxID=2953763 RepID=UPI0028A087A5|nr:hypothetical protein [Hydrogenoanaerobacterium sp.]